MKYRLFLNLMVTIMILSAYGADPSKRILIGTYMTEEAFSQAGQKLKNSPDFVSLQREYHFEILSRIQGTKKVLYLEKFDTTKELLNTFVVVSRNFPKAFIEEYADTEKVESDAAKENRDLPAYESNVTAVKGEGSVGTLWEDVEIDEYNEKNISDKSGMKLLVREESANPAIPDTEGVGQAAKDDTVIEAWSSVQNSEQSIKKSVSPMGEDIIASETIQDSENNRSKQEYNESILPVKEEMIETDSLSDSVKDQTDSIMDKEYEIKLVFDTKTLLVSLLLLLLLWLLVRRSRRSKAVIDNKAEISRPDAQQNLVDILINKKTVEPTPRKKRKRRGLDDILSGQDEEVPSQWKIQTAGRTQTRSSNGNYPLVIDLHSHLIPNIDDGSDSMKESVGMIRELYALGYRKIITTPHIMSHRFPNSAEIILDGLAKLKAELIRQGVDIVVEAAAEYYLDEHLGKLIAEKKILTFGKNYLLFELSYNVKPLNLENLVALMQANGYQPVLAHPERYQYMRRDFKVYEKLKASGVLFQVNINSLGGFYASEAKKTAMKLSDKGMIDFLGSDAHSMRHLQAMAQTIKTDTFTKIFNANTIRNNTL